MKVVYKNKKDYIDFEVDAFDTIEGIEDNPKICFNVDQIYDDVISGFHALPKKLQRHRLMMYTYWGDLTCMYQYYDRSSYLSFDDREFFLKEPNELIDVDPSIDPYSSIYIKINRIHMREYESMIVSYVKYRLSFDGIELIGNDDTIYYNTPRDGEEYLLNSWAPNQESHSYKMVRNIMNGYEDLIDNEESKYIPNYGKSSTKYGEILRACQRIKYRYFNDGDECTYIHDGNIISYLNLAEMMYNWIPEESEEFKYLVDKLNEIERHPVDINWIKGVFYEQCDGDYAVMFVIKIEIALIKTKEKYPDLLNTENTVDSREWQDCWY